MPSSEAALSKARATRLRILGCAVARFADDGFRGASVAQIARDANVTAPTVHAHFGSKEELFQAALAHDIGALWEVMRARLDGGIPVASTVELVPDLVARVDAHPLARRVFQGREADRTRDLPGVPAVVRARAELTRLVAGGQRDGVLRRDLPAAALAGALETLVLALLLGAVQAGLTDETPRLAISAIISGGLRG